MKRRRVSLFSILSGIALLVLLAVNLIPLLLVVRQGFTPESVSVSWPLKLLPKKFGLENFEYLWRSKSLTKNLLLSFWVAFATTFFSIALGFPAGWAAARWKKLEGFTTRLSIISRILPPIAIAIPLTALLIPIGFYNSRSGIGLILAHLTLGIPFSILLAYAAFRDIPREIEEAAYVDGCSIFGTFLRVSLPMVKGSIGAAFILIFILSWDEFAYALLIQVTNRTMPPLIYYYAEYGQLGSASVLAVIMLFPAILVIATLQKLIARGVIAGGIKG